MINSYVLRHIRTDESGFSLMEVMTAIVLISVIVTATMMCFSVWRQLDIQFNQPSDQELLLFQVQLDLMFESANEYEVTGNSRLHTWGTNSSIEDTYSQHQSVIRRQVNGMGHEVFMQRITHFRVYPHPKGVELHLKLEDTDRKWVMYHPNAFVERNRDAGNEDSY